MRPTAAARRYARALFSLATEMSTVDETARELDGMAALLADSPELTNALFRPLHPVAERRALLRAICERGGSSDVIRNFYSVLVENRRLVNFAAIHEEYRRLADEAAGRTQAEVVAANPLDDAQLERLRRALAARTGKQIELSVRIDPSLIGGAVATVGGLVFDGSLRTQLSQLRATLTEGHGADGHQAG
jgi:F-type H+-transporting ATPase subunit delta